RQRRLAQPRWTGEEHVVQRLVTPARGRYEDLELVAHLRLADEVLEPSRSKRPVELLVGARGTGRLEALDARGADAAAGQRATFGPTPWTPTSMRNSSRSSSEPNPYRFMPSSRSTRCV